MNVHIQFAKDYTVYIIKGDHAKNIQLDELYLS